MDLQAKRALLAESPLFDNLLPTELHMLAELFSERDFGAGDTVFQEGEVGDSLFVIAKGSVDIIRKNAKGEPKVLLTLEAREFFGEMSLIDKEYRSATVRARTDTQLLHLSNDNLHIFAKNFRNGFTWVVVNIARVLSARLRETNRRLAERL